MFTVYTHQLFTHTARLLAPGACTHMYTYIHICVVLYICVCICVYTHVYTYMGVGARVGDVYLQQVARWIDRCTYTHCLYIQTIKYTSVPYTCVDIYTCTYVDTSRQNKFHKHNIVRTHTLFPIAKFGRTRSFHKPLHKPRKAQHVKYSLPWAP